MTENKRTAQLLEAYRKLRPSSVAIKLNQRIGQGVPDCVIVDLGQTFWLEAKKEGRDLTPTQAHLLGRLRTASARRTVVAFYTKDNAVRLVYDAPAGVTTQRCGSIVEAARFLEQLIASRA